MSMSGVTKAKWLIPCQRGDSGSASEVGMTGPSLIEPFPTMLGPGFEASAVRGLEQWIRIDPDAVDVADPHVEVEVGCGGVAGLADQPDHRCGGDVTVRSLELRHVRVVVDVAVVGVQVRHLPACALGGIRDRSGSHCPLRGSRGSEHVGAVV